MKTRLLVVIGIVCLAIVLPAMIGNHIQIVLNENTFQYPPPQNLTANNLQRVLDNCNNPTALHIQPLYRYFNGTHTISSNTCKWIENETLKVGGKMRDEICVATLEHNFCPSYYIGTVIEEDDSIMVKVSGSYLGIKRDYTFFIKNDKLWEALEHEN